MRGTRSMPELVRNVGSAVLQGLPQTGRRKFGVPDGGAFDQNLHQIANALLGSPADTQTWEIVGSATFRGTGWLGVAGGEVIQDGNTVTVQPEAGLARCYVATRKENRPLCVRRYAGIHSHDPHILLRATLGPQSHVIDPRHESEQPFAVSNACDRAGIRLESPTYHHGVSLRSEAACFGTIQIPDGGCPIVLGPDGPTMGGYPKVAVVISADHPKLAQLLPGQHVWLEFVTLDQARSIAAEELKKLRSLLAELTLSWSLVRR